VSSVFARFNRINFSILRTILVVFGPETSQCMPNNSTFGGDTTKIGISCKISKNFLAILTYFTGLVDVLVGMIIQIFVWWSFKGRCYGNQLNLGDVCKCRVERPSLFASAFDNGLTFGCPLFFVAVLVIFPISCRCLGLSLFWCRRFDQAPFRYVQSGRGCWARRRSVSVFH